MPVLRAVVGQPTVEPATRSPPSSLVEVGPSRAWASLTRTWPEVLVVAGRWWWLPLGVVGWVIVAALGWTANRLGVSVALAVIVAAQLTVGLAADAVRGVGTVSWRSVGGIVLFVAGAALLSSSTSSE